MNQNQVFGRSCGQNLVYLNKVYYDGQGSSCPIIYDLATNSTSFKSNIRISDSCADFQCGSPCSCQSRCQNSCYSCGCCSSSCSACSSFELSATTQFTITNTCAVITSILPSSTSTFAADDVIVDGYAATSLTLSDGKYTADLSGTMDDITQNPCTPVDMRICPPCQNSPECAEMSCGNFFLAYVTGPWNVGMEITVDGYAVNDAQCCRFKACFQTITSTETQENISVPGNNNFALYNLDIPCKSNGVSPYLSFDFNACAILMNPSLSMATTESGTQLTLTASMVITPSINLQVIRSALFSLSADEVPTPCDNIGQYDPCAMLQCTQNECGVCGQTVNSQTPCSSGQCSGGQCGCQAQSSSGSCSGGCGGSGAQYPCACGNSATQQAENASACQYCGTNGYSF